MNGKYNGSCRIVLLAEDDVEMRLALSKALQKEGCSVIECKDGIDLQTRLYPLLKGDYDLDYDLIITDIRMPVITGIGVIEELSKLESSPPVIVITSSGDIFTRERARRLGASAILDKPINVEYLTKVARNMILASRSPERKRHRPPVDGISGQ